jgi:hypothetical protein
MRRTNLKKEFFAKAYGAVGKHVDGPLANRGHLARTTHQEATQ